MESRLELEELKIRVSDLEEMVSNLIKWTHYNHQSSGNSIKVNPVNYEKDENSSNPIQSKGSPKTNVHEEKREIVALVCPNFEDDDKFIPDDRDTDDKMEADVDEIKIGPLEAVKVEENYYRNIESLLADESDDISTFERIGEAKAQRFGTDNEEDTGMIAILDEDSDLIPSSDKKIENIKKCTNKKRRPNSRKQEEVLKKTPRRSFRCGMCEKSFTQECHQRRHEDTVHFGQKKFKCLHCGRKFGDKGHMNRHIDAVHFGQKKFTCSHCLKNFARKYTMTKHIKSVHFR